jgi:hypothetical protein
VLLTNMLNHSRLFFLSFASVALSRCACLDLDKPGEANLECDSLSPGVGFGTRFGHPRL